MTRRFGIMDQEGTTVISEGANILDAIQASPLLPSKVVYVEDLTTPLDRAVSDVWRKICRSIAERAQAKKEADHA